MIIKGVAYQDYGVYKKELKKVIKEDLRAYFTGRKISLVENRSLYYLSLSIHIEDLTQEEQKIAYDIVKEYQDAGDTDIMTDYFDYNFYFNISKIYD